MIQKIYAPITVISTYDHKRRSHKPSIVVWEGKTYKITNIGYHHKFREGKRLQHVFSVSSEELFFKIVLDTEALSWTLEEISDGLPD